MGDQRHTPTGVKPREKSIQIRFKLEGEKNYTYESLPWRPNPANIKRAGLLRAQIVNEIKHGIFNYASHFPDSPHANGRSQAVFADYAQTWLDNPENDWKPQSRYKFKGILQRVWMPALQTIKIQHIQYTHLSNALSHAVTVFKDKNKKEPSKSLYNDWLICIRGVFETAIKDGAITSANNPAAEFKNKTRDKTTADPFDMEEANLIISTAYDQYGDVWGAWFELGFYSGMRYPSEPSALSWQDVDLRKGEIRISKIRARKTIQNTTKTGRDRILLLNSKASAALQRLKAHTFMKETFIFLNDKDQPVITADPQRKMWKYLLKKTGIRYRDMYNMRHTYATFGLTNGINPAFMAEQLGHSVEEFFSTYARWINAGQNQIQMELMERALGNSKTPASTWMSITCND